MKAIIVIADPSRTDIEKNIADRFLLEGDFIRKALKKKFGFPEADIFYIVCNHLQSSTVKLFELLETIFSENPGEDICLFYNGHGHQDGWAVNGTTGQMLIYNNLRFIFSQHRGCLIFINSCCHAGAAAVSVQDRKNKRLLIAAMPDGIEGLVHLFIRGIFKCWERGKLFNPECARASKNYAPVIFGNEDLQKLFINLRENNEVKSGAEEILGLAAIAAAFAVAAYPLIQLSGIHDLLTQVSIYCAKAIFSLFGVQS